MKIKRGSSARPEPAGTPANEGQNAGANAGATRFASKSANRILIPITAAGLIDLNKMNRDAKKQLLDLAGREDVQKQLGIGKPAVTFDPEQCQRLYDAVGRIYATVGKYLLKMPVEATDQLAYTDDEKKALGEPTAKMLDSYAPDWLAKHQALAMWAAVFVSISQEKWIRALQVAEFLKKGGSLDQMPATGDGMPATPREQ